MRISCAKSDCENIDISYRIKNLDSKESIYMMQMNKNHNIHA